MHPVPLTVADAGELLTIQRAAYASEAQLYGDPFLPALTETLSDISADLDVHPSLGIRIEGRLVAAVRWKIEGDVARLNSFVVAPDMQSRGLGQILLRAAERDSGAEEAELLFPSRSLPSLALCRREGYEEVRRLPLGDDTELVFLRKNLLVPRSRADRVIGALPLRVWRLLTDERERWWPELQFAAVPGAEVLEEWTESGVTATAVGRVLEVAPPALLSFEWAEPHWSGSNRVEIGLRFHPDGTRVVIEERGHVGWDGAAEHDAGWAALLERLAAVTR